MKPKHILISWQQPGDDDDVRHRSRPMRTGIDPKREARSLAHRQGVPRGTEVYMSVWTETEPDHFKRERIGSFVWEHT